MADGLKLGVAEGWEEGNSDGCAIGATDGADVGMVDGAACMSIIACQWSLHSMGRVWWKRWRSLDMSIVTYRWSWHI